VVKASRRAILRGVLNSSGFELEHDTANEVLMRINQSLDPEPLTEGMWASYVAIRRELRYSKYDREQEADAAGTAIDVGDPIARVNLRDLAEHVAKDFRFLLRVETLLRMWPPSSRVDAGTVSLQDPRHHILVTVKNEIRHYLNDCEESESYQRDVLVPVIRCLTKAAGIEMPPGHTALLDVLS
jgi:hypothetical protein